MFATISRKAVRSLAPRVRVTLGARNNMSSLGDTLDKKGKVEEDRYTRAKEVKQLAKIHIAMIEQAQAAAAFDAESQFEEHVAPVMNDIEDLLAAGDSLSDASLEAIARWKLALE